MQYAPPDSDEISELQELNLLFLTHIQLCCVRDGTDSMGMPTAVVRLLRNLPTRTLERMALFPRSLFVIQFGDTPTMQEPRALSDVVLEHSRQALKLTVLLSAWNMSRQRDFQARVFLRLSADTVRTLRTVPLSELPSLATTPGLLNANFPGAAALWAALLSSEEAELTRALRLAALQPGGEFRGERYALAADAGL